MQDKRINYQEKIAAYHETKVAVTGNEKNKVTFNNIQPN